MWKIALGCFDFSPNFNNDNKTFQFIQIFGVVITQKFDFQFDKNFVRTYSPY